jgi:hypothetical protein
VRARLPTILILLVAAAIFAAVFALNAARERAVIDEARALVANTARQSVDPQHVLTLARSMKLVTVELTTSMTVQRSAESWRGGVSASVQTPVRLHYGVDLSTLTRESIAIGSPVDGVGVLVVRIARPTRIAAEIIAGEEVTSVDVGWARTRSRAGEYYLGLARRDMPEELQKLALTPTQKAKIEAETLSRVRELITEIVGANIKVLVRYDADPPAPSPDQPQAP